MLDPRDIYMLGPHTREKLVGPQSCPDLERHRIVAAGLTDAGEGLLFVRHEPWKGQLLVCTGGTGQVYVDGEWRNCTSDMAYATPSGAYHAYRTVGRRRWQFCWVKYDHDSLPVVSGSKPILTQADARGLLEVITCLHREVYSKADRCIMSRLADLVDVFARRITGPVGTGDRLRKVWEAVIDDLSHPWTLSELAGLIGVSEEHLRRLCRKQTGCSPIQQVARLRMQRACDLLASTPSRILDVAVAVGYENAFAFTVAFRRAFGMTPSLYRKGVHRSDAIPGR